MRACRCPLPAALRRPGRPPDPVKASGRSAYPVRVINVRDFPFTGGCLRCAVSGKCVYRDGFDELLRTQIQTADAIVTAFTISGPYSPAERHSLMCF